MSIFENPKIQNNEPKCTQPCRRPQVDVGLGDTSTSSRIALRGSLASKSIVVRHLHSLRQTDVVRPSGLRSVSAIMEIRIYMADLCYHVNRAEASGPDRRIH